MIWPNFVFFVFFVCLCGEKNRCEGCTRSDCGKHKCCMNKPRFGGLGKRKQCSELKFFLSIPAPTPLVTQFKNICGVQCPMRCPPVTRSKNIQGVPCDINWQVSTEQWSENPPYYVVGNCMFRTFSYAFHNHEEHYFHVSSHIVRTIELNQKVFSECLYAH